MWFKVASTNSDPRVIARYYLEAVEAITGKHIFAHYNVKGCEKCYNNYIGCPRIVRADHGTENCSVAKIHIAMRQFHDDQRSGSRSFIYGPSTSNIVN